METGFLGFILIFAIFFALRYFFEDDYRKRERKWILFDIIITSFLAFTVQQVFNYIFN